MVKNKAVYTNEYGDSFEFSLEAKCVITDPDFLTGQNASIAITQGIGQVGGSFGNSIVEAKNFTVNGKFIGICTAKKQELLSVVLPQTRGKLIVCDKYYLDVMPTKTPYINPAERYADFQFSLTAAYPYWSSIEKKTEMLAGVIPRFKFPWLLTAPYVFSTKTNGNFTNILNNGHVDIPYTLTFTASGDVVNPQVVNIKTFETIKYNGSLENDEVLTIIISHDKYDAESSIYGDVDGKIDIESNLFRLHPGENVLKYTATENREGLSVEISFEEEYVGVVQK